MVVDLSAKSANFAPCEKFPLYGILMRTPLLISSLLYRVFSSFTMETILATAFGRQVELQRGESDQLSQSMGLLVGGFTSGQVEKFILLESESFSY